MWCFRANQTRFWKVHDSVSSTFSVTKQQLKGTLIQIWYSEQVFNYCFLDLEWPSRAIAYLFGEHTASWHVFHSEATSPSGQPFEVRKRRKGKKSLLPCLYQLKMREMREVETISLAMNKGQLFIFQTWKLFHVPVPSIISIEYKSQNACLPSTIERLKYTP